MNRLLHKSAKYFFRITQLTACVLLLVFSKAQAQTVTSPTVTAITPTTATLGGNVTAGPLTNRGTRWSTLSPVGTSNEMDEASIATGVFTQARTGLPAASLIYFTAYAQNGAGIPVETPEATFFTEPTQLTIGQFTATASGETSIVLNFPSAESWEGSEATGGYVIFRKDGSAPSLGALADGAAPPADGVGDKIATITDGTATSFNNTTGLSAETNYYYTIIPFVWDGTIASTYNYNTSTPQTANDFTFSVEPVAHPSDGAFTVTSVSPSQVDLAFDAPSAGTDGYIILRRNDGSDPTTAGITDGVDPLSLALPAGTTLAGTSMSSSFNNTLLSAATHYSYLIIPYNANASEDAGTYNYKTDGTPVTPKSDWTFATEPSGHATGSINATAVSSTQIDLSFNSVTASGITNAAGYIVLIKSSEIDAADLATLNDGEAPDGFGLFEAIINSTSTNSYSSESLTPNTTYHYAIIPYNRGSDDETYNFLTTTGFITGSATTLDISATFVEIPGGTLPVISGTVLGAGTTAQVIAGFSVTSDGTQEINSLLFQYTGAQFTGEYLYRSTTVGALGTQIASDASPDGNFNWSTDILLANRTINSTPVYYYLVVDVVNTVTTATANFSVTLSQANVTVNTGEVNDFSINKTFSFNTSQLSDIVLNGGTTSTINYINHRQVDVTNGKPSLATFRIRDGAGVADGDNKNTILTALTVELTNHTFVKRVALYDGGSEIGSTEQVVTGATVSFSGLTLTATDGSTKDFTLRATFNNTVTDKEEVHVTITSATASTAGSGFATADAGGASSSTAAPTNVIEVTATVLAFQSNPPNTPVNTNFSLTVRAQDAQSNVDRDFTGQVALAASGGPGTLSTGSQSQTPSLVLGQFTWTELRISQSGTYTLEAEDSEDELGSASGSVIITSSASNITQAPDPVLCYGGNASFKTLGNITIAETDAAGISGDNGSYNFRLALPAGFVFDQSVTSGLAVSGEGDLSSPSAYSYPGDNIVQFSFTLNGTANVNTITIGGLRVRHPHPGIANPDRTPLVGTLPITRLGGTANIAGVTDGTALGSISGSQAAPATVTFTVSSTDAIPIDPNTTNFNINSNAVNLIGSHTPGVFSGEGVTSVPNYRFNPGPAGIGSHPITYLHTAAGTGCQSVGTATFTVFTSGINNLEPDYCTNDPVSGVFSVDQTFIDQRIYWYPPGTWSVDYYVYYDVNVFDFRPITNPENARFNPSLPVYQNTVQSFGGQIPIGFAVCSAAQGIPCNANKTNPANPHNFGVYDTYQWVTIRPAPAVNLSLPSDIYIYCDDNAPVLLTGSPPNSNNIADDFFTASGGQGGSISPPVIGNEWFFSPTLVSGVTPTTSQTFNITYQHKDPTTGCSNTATKPVTVHDRPSAVPIGNITKSPPGPPAASTTIQLCQGTSVGSFSATDPDYTYRWYADPIGPANLKGALATFNPPVDNLVPGTTPFYVTRIKNGCESINPLALSVNVIAAPVAPTPNFLDAIRQYCVGSAINDTHLGIPGTSVKWYNSSGTLVHSGSFPTAADLGLSTAAATVYTFNVTQTEGVNNCEGPPTTVTVTIKALPIVSLSADVPADPNKICTTGGTVTFSAFDNADAGNPAINGSWSGSGLIGSLNERPTLGKVDLNPSALSAGPYTLNYNYTNSAGCSNIGSIGLTILPIVTPNISIGNVCDGSPAIINNTSVINPPTSTISTVTWTFGDGQVLPLGQPDSYTTTIDPTIHSGNTTGTYQNPNHIYPNVGTFQLTGTFLTSDGCSYSIPQTPVNVSELPIANFTWSNVCVNSTTGFQATTNLADASIQSYNWTFAKEGVLNTGTGSGKNTSYVYTVTGKDSIRLIVTTIAQCKDTVVKPVYIVPTYSPITSINSYAEDFTTNGGWIAGGVNSSWELGTPTGAPIIGDASPSLTGNAWDTNLAGDNNPNESSWVLSGCFDFTSALKPVVSIDIWSDNPNGVDGAVLQYNETGNIEDKIPNNPDSDGDWERIGVVGSGINWYDDQGISNSPGNQTTISAGWTGRYPQWRKAIFKLDNLVGKSGVVFRIAFASSQPRGDGFAFDNIFVGERSRVVLLENFTNTSTNLSPTTGHNSFYRTFGNAAEVVKIQYHTAFPGADPINNLNQQMNNSRAAFYGITESPTARLDGNFGSGNIINWLQPNYDDRVLTPSPVKLAVSAVKVGSQVKINTTVENTSTQTLPISGVHIFTTIVQKSITDPILLGSSGDTEFVFVAKQMLPSPAGLTIPTDIGPGGSYVAPEVTWDNPNGDAIVVFIQAIEGNNKNVYQAFLLDNPPMPDVITGTEDPAYGDKINLFPNPANHELNIQLPATVTRNTPVLMFDTYGRTVYENSFAPGEQSKTINTSELTGGVYIIQVNTPEGNTARRKIMVVHR